MTTFGIFLSSEDNGPRALVEQLDDYIEEHPWLDRNAVVGEAINALLAKQLSPLDKVLLERTMGAKPHD